VTETQFHKWSRLTARIIQGETSTEEEICPNCGARTVRCVALGNESTRMGYALCWCDTCLNGISISRIKVHEDFPLHPFSVDPDLLNVPRFKEVSPE
jgi:hypothetical protein